MALVKGFYFHQFNITYCSWCLVLVWRLLKVARTLCSYICLVLRDHGVNMYFVYIWKWSSTHALGGVSGVASFITTDEQLK